MGETSLKCDFCCPDLRGLSGESNTITEMSFLGDLGGLEDFDLDRDLLYFFGESDFLDTTRNNLDLERDLPLY